ncbi:NAD(P)H dehydrogenase (quinone) [Burkholderia ambifaria]
MTQHTSSVKAVVVYHSGYGHTARMAAAVAEGAGAELVAIDADGNIAAHAWDMLAGADAIVFGSPTYMGGPSWQFKKFADASSKVWFDAGGATRSLAASPTAQASTATSSIRSNTSSCSPASTAGSGRAWTSSRRT